MAGGNLGDVVKLRKLTGAGMMDCKNALEEAQGNIEKAIELIRERGKAIANKRADRDASEGVVLAMQSPCACRVSMLALNCETDFVAKNKDFIALAEKILKAALEQYKDTLDAVKQMQIDGRTAEELVMELSGVTGEKMELSFYDMFCAASTAIYMHPGNKLAAMVGFSKDLPNEELGFEIAMQIAGMNPVAIDADSVPKELRDKEFEIGREQARLEGKPEQILDKIAEGRLQKYLKENTLMAQEFVKEGKISVEQYIARYDKDLRVKFFTRFSLTD